MSITANRVAQAEEWSGRLDEFISYIQFAIEAVTVKGIKDEETDTDALECMIIEARERKEQYDAVLDERDRQECEYMNREYESERI